MAGGRGGVENDCVFGRMTQQCAYVCTETGGGQEWQHPQGIVEACRTVLSSHGASHEAFHPPLQTGFTALFSDPLRFPVLGFLVSSLPGLALGVPYL